MTFPSNVIKRWSRNLLAVAAGIVLGGALNSLVIYVSGYIVAPPTGVDLRDPADLRLAAPFLEPPHFATPFLAHAFGTLCGSLAAYLIAASRRITMALIVGAIFFAGGVAASSMIPAPSWFIKMDLLVAYLPMAWFATRIGQRIHRRQRARSRSSHTEIT